MSRTFPWHSAASASYHNNSDCRAGERIERHARLDGTGGKPLCGECAALNQAERQRYLPGEGTPEPPTFSRRMDCGFEPGLGGAGITLSVVGARASR